jgi:GNAT superfamily N-acetyltransferase
MSYPEKSDPPDDLSILPVESAKDLDCFIRVPWSIYDGDPCWIPPLIFERKEHLSAKNPYFRHARWQAWIAFRNNKPVGRVSAQVDLLRLERYRDATGLFGFLEAGDDPATFQLLLDTACGWLRQQGMKRVQGPFNLSINDECGLLVEGFDRPPSVMMGHARPYYAGRIEALGFSKAKDLLAYRLNMDFVLPRAMSKLTARNSKRITVSPLKRARLKQDLVILRDLFNDAWSSNWGFVPFTREEFDDLGRNLARLVDEDLIQVAAVDGKPAAMIVALPNLNEAACDLDGRLLPLGWLKLLWRLKKHKLRTARVTLMGVRQEYQNSRLGMALAYAVIDAVRVALITKGIDEVEMSWILEDNTNMRHILESLGGDPYKRYRIYEKDI